MQSACQIKEIKLLEDMRGIAGRKCKKNRHPRPMHSCRWAAPRLDDRNVCFGQSHGGDLETGPPVFECRILLQLLAAAPAEHIQAGVRTGKTISDVALGRAHTLISRDHWSASRRPKLSGWNSRSRRI